MLRNLGIRWKILAILALPVLVLLLAGGVISYQALASARTASQAGALAAAGDEFSALVNALQTERQISVSAISAAGRGNPVGGDLGRARAATDAASRDFRQAVAAAQIDQLSVEAASALYRSEHGHARLATVRSGVDRPATAQWAATADLVTNTYDQIIDAYVLLPAAIGATLSDRGQAARLASFTQLAQVVEGAMREQLAGERMIATHKATAENVRDLTLSIAAQDQALDELPGDGGRRPGRRPRAGLQRPPGDRARAAA